MWGPLSPPSMYLAAREAIDAGAGDLMAAIAPGQIQPTPHGRAVLAAIEAAASADEVQWHTALQHAVDHDLRSIAVDALEGLAVAAAAAEGWAECLHLCYAAERLRDDTGYRWRFPSEQAAVNAAINAARTNLAPDAADTAVAAGRVLDWREAAAYAQRARGERKRPHHGWASLTPTEQQVVAVVAVVAEGLTNPQIGERLLMGRATVKTHLEHIFAKTGVHTRSELAAEYTQRRPI
jgi:DNA-binding NarL/FixJ family response regulator